VAILRGRSRFQLGLSQRIRTLGQASGNPMFAPMTWCFGKVWATALAVDHKVLRGAIALASNLRLTIGQQLDIASEYDRYRLVDTAVARWESRLGPLGNLCHSLTPCLTGWCLWQGFTIQHVIPTDFCYNSHRSIPLCEGLTVGV
jgi:hypothetical protein